MASRAAVKLKEAMQQYSKKMATRVTVFWMLYRVICLVIVFFRPSVAASINRLTEGVDTIMIVNMSVYTGNSATEKIAIAFGKRAKLYSSDDESEREPEDEEQEEHENDD